MTKFHGFRESDFKQVKDFAAALQLELQAQEMGVSGRSWGEAVLTAGALSFQNSGKVAFELDCADISGVTQQARPAPRAPGLRARRARARCARLDALRVGFAEQDGHHG